MKGWLLDAVALMADLRRKARVEFWLEVYKYVVVFEGEGIEAIFFLNYSWWIL